MSANAQKQWKDVQSAVAAGRDVHLSFVAVDVGGGKGEIWRPRVSGKATRESHHTWV